MKALAALLTFLLAAASLSASAKRQFTGDDLDSRKKTVLLRGLDSFYNADYPEAEAAFDEYIALDRKDPVGYWRKLLAEYFAVRAAQKNDMPRLTARDYEAISTLAKEGIALAESNVKDGISPDFNRYVAGSMLSVFAALQLKYEGKLVAKHSLHRAFDLASQSQYQDAGSLLGMINMKLAEHSKIIQWLVDLPHDRKRGKTMIFQSVVQNTSPFVDDIWFIIFDMETDRTSPDSYEKTEIDGIWNYLFKKYPRNPSLVEYKEKTSPPR